MASGMKSISIAISCANVPPLEHISLSRIKKQKAPERKIIPKEKRESLATAGGVSTNATAAIRTPPPNATVP